MGNARVCQEKNPLFIAQRRRKQKKHGFMCSTRTTQLPTKTACFAGYIRGKRYARSGLLERIACNSSFSFTAATLIDPFYSLLLLFL